jgi:ankyrin repeat protein
MKLLLEKADIASKPSNGQMPLSWAAESGHEEVVKLLLEKGAEKIMSSTTGKGSVNPAGLA